ncbi:ranBP-type and C3HC4-type zinc finger-containing protein 1 isoform X1 [Aplysia californica]|uniref:RanBP-type and C3HC4-type zinc finger-containing protein 1 n=1 Tax=Aplysia californica TaxID=6500 RepID=A0ABM1VS09_APLCA|nr:ranBP-type and C3HC4-type zinc finger-containing protein 1 isoform X1 [Aplysia californica]XP_035825202.1 ranBP-type and C3HC4-type zinc finger-containing protein 1 isoform X1 [Aplysia californica]XP_035825203.1 ranBP-type and C3HC4-type zinc finger-containing protein 1 isoform X1 [Aplysia californica]
MEMSSHNSSTKSSFYEEGPSDLVQKLTAAIQAGENDKATELVAELTSRKLKLDIAVPKEDNEIRAKENEFSVKVHVEDRESKGCIINMMVKSCDTVGDLKRKMMLQHDFPLEVQRWIIGKRISNDKEKLSHCGVKEAGHTLYLYLVTARSVGLTRQQYDLHKQAALQGVPISGQSLFHRESSSDQSMWNLHLDGQLQCFNGTAVNTHSTSSALNMADLSQGQPSPVAVSTSPGSRHSVSGGSLKLQEMLASVPASQALSSSSGLAFDPSEDDLSPAVSPLVMAGPRWSRASRSPSPGPSSPKETQSIEQVGWKCPRCTLINLPMRPGCELCSGSRPSDYHVPDGYQPTAEEMKLMENDQRLERLTREARQMQLVANYQSHLALDELDLVPNPEPFLCPICFDDFGEGEGILLRDCLHVFCKDCLTGAVQHSDEAELRCPFQDDQYSCQALLQEREIRALVPPEVYMKFLQRGLNLAETAAKDSYHCKTSDCIGWCIYEDLVNFFKCPVCQKENCLTCKAIHEGLNCKQYQDDIRIRANNDMAARQTKEMLEGLVERGEAMHCPQCGVVVQKKDGCDWIKCSICKTELCWVTKMARWGPKGNGDITGGCRCRVNNTKCHPNCINCH